ncbi:hypothetical protein K491DRAFT_593325 [Lophiostoma macrostomum CBS 122681]|uniref:Ribosomal protein L34 n=1 Tax=Lophiostoma macrostomum CBS 122681 TaxID=1314788 RepID=A0A6A6TGB5_9PLEO|nr:hypothetical protein K491DRAFT_593325 [Lophiostoma macrostomum CBS 122681]
MNAFRCLRVIARPANITATGSIRPCIERVSTPLLTPPQSRTLSLLSARRPGLPPSTSTTSSFSPSSILPSGTPDILPPPTSHPALSSPATQIRHGPRDTYNPSHLVRMRRHGIEGRFATKNGRKMLMRRLKRGRWNLAHFEGEWARGVMMGRWKVRAKT